MGMLVLTRRTMEAVHLHVNRSEMQGDSIDIEVYVLGQKGSQVRLGLYAPRYVSIDREEVHQRKLREMGLDETSDRT